LDRTVKRGNICVVGMLGAVASGKSTVARLLAQCARARGRDATVIEGDSIGHEVLLLPEVRQRLRREFGEEICGPDGAVARDRLAQMVFGAPERLKTLNAIVHPVIIDTIDQRIHSAARAAKGEGAVVVLDAPLLIETGLDQRYCDRMVFVDASGQARAGRVESQRGWDAAELARRDAAQVPSEAKRQLADFVIDNDGEESDLRGPVEEVMDQMIAALSRADEGARH